MEALLKYIENIRNKPEHVRVRYVFVFVFSIMGVVIFIWLFSLHHFFGDIFQSNQIQELQDSTTSWKGEFEEYLKDDTIQNLNFDEFSKEGNFLE